MGPQGSQQRRAVGDAERVVREKEEEAAEVPSGSSSLQELAGGGRRKWRGACGIAD